jgi:hypothetical protein
MSAFSEGIIPRPDARSARAEQEHVMSALEACLRRAPGSWRASVSGRGVVAHTWILDIVRLEDGASGRVLVDERSADPAAPLRRALAVLSPTGML